VDTGEVIPTVYPENPETCVKNVYLPCIRLQFPILNQTEQRFEPGAPLGHSLNYPNLEARDQHWLFY